MLWGRRVFSLSSSSFAFCSFRSFASSSTETEKTFYLVPTPIGNKDDITKRAIDILSSVDVVACEDTRETLSLLRRIGISERVRKLERLDQNTLHQVRTENLLSSNLFLFLTNMFDNERNRYQQIAFVTDGGTPGISDPGGADLLKKVKEKGFKVRWLPGATAITTALGNSGLPMDQFCFEGFLPRSGKLREERLRRISFETRSCVVFESPRRVEKTLLELMNFCEEGRECALIREMTKEHEESISGSIASVVAKIQERGNVLGECCLVIGPRDEEMGLVSKEEESGRQGFSNLEIEWYNRFHSKGLTGKSLTLALMAVGMSRTRAYHLVHGLELKK